MYRSAALSKCFYQIRARTGSTVNLFKRSSGSVKAQMLETFFCFQLLKSISATFSLSPSLWLSFTLPVPPNSEENAEESWMRKVVAKSYWAVLAATLQRAFFFLACSFSVFWKCSLYEVTQCSLGLPSAAAYYPVLFSFPLLSIFNKTKYIQNS